jgi:transposase-like protein
MDYDIGSSKRRRRTAAQRQRLLARYHRSQLSQAEFAARHGIGHSTLARWLSDARADDRAPMPFAEVSLPPASRPWAVEIASPSGWTVRLQNAATPSALPQLLSALPC